MKKHFLCSLAFVTFGCGSGGDLTNFPEQPASRASTLLVKMRDDANPEQSIQAKQTLEEANAVNTDRLPNDVLRIQVTPSMAGAEEALCQQLVESGAVEFAEPDYLLPPLLIPNDPSFGQQWALQKVAAPGAWDLARGQSSVVVGVCDTGVLASHPDLAPNLMLPGYNSVDKSSNTNPIHPHGTMVAGCISAQGNNGLGVAGLAYGVKILPIKVSNDPSGSAYLSDMATGVRWAADRGARLINLSYSGAQYATMDSAAQYARSKNALLFMAAGNEGRDINASHPDYPSFILVGSTQSADQRSSWSNYGKAVDMAAPGENILTTTLNNGYASVSGTSFASPYAVAGAALLLSANPALTVSQLESHLLNGCDDLGAIGEDDPFGRGRLNALKALRLVTGGNALNQPPRAVLNAQPGAGVAPLTVTWNGGASSDPEGGSLRFSWAFSEGGSGTGASLTRTYTQPGTYQATLTVTDNKGASQSSTASLVVSPNPLTIQPPDQLKARLSGNLLTLTWKDNSNNESGFYVERADQVRAAGRFSRFYTAPSNATTFSHNLSPGTYLYRVQAYNQTRTSAFSAIISVTR